jgi:hypothetical protein
LPPMLSSLNLSPAQQTQIQSILSNAQTQGLSQEQVQGEVSSVLTTSQSQQLAQKLQTASADRAGSTSSASEPTLSSGLTASDLQKQIAAGMALLLQQMQTEIGAAPTSSS